MSQAKRLTRLGSTNKQLSACDGVNFYYGVGTAICSRLAWTDREDSTAGTAGHNFGAGYSVGDLFADDRQPGIVYAVVSTTATSKYSIYRSADSGATFTFEKRLGDIDGTDANQEANMRTLEGGRGITLHDFRDGNGLQLFVVEYAPSGSTNVRILKRNGAGTWSNVWQSLGTVKHLHCVRTDRLSNYLYIGSGDTNAQSFIAEWDGANAWVDGVLPQNTGVVGLSAIGGDQSCRTVDILADLEYIYWAADTSSAQPESGIYRARKNGLGGKTKINNDMADLYGTLRYGWHGVSLPDGSVYIADSGELSPYDCNFIYGKKSASEFEVVGRLNQVAGTGGTAGNFRTGYNNGVIWMTYSGVAGLHSAFTGFYEPGEVFAEERPDILAPLFYVGSTGTNDINTGYGGTPDLPYLTLQYALTSSHVTWGSAIMLQNSVTENKFTAACDSWTTGGRAAQTGEPVQIASIGTKKTVTHAAGDANANYVNFGHNDLVIEFDGVDLNSAKASDDIVLGSTSLTGLKIIFRDSIVGAGGVHTNAVECRELTCWAIRSDIYSGTGPAINYTTGYGGHLKAIASIFYGTQIAAYLRGTGSTLEMYNCALVGAATYHVERIDTTGTDPVIRNTVSINSTTGSVRYNGGSDTAGGLDYCALDRATTAAGRQGANSFIDASVELLYSGSDVTAEPLNPAVRVGGVAIPDAFPLPKFDRNKIAFDPDEMPIGVLTNYADKVAVDLIASGTAGTGRFMSRFGSRF